MDKPFLIKYDLNYSGFKDQLKLVYAKSFEEALEKLQQEIIKFNMKSNECYNFSIVPGTIENLTIE